MDFKVKIEKDEDGWFVAAVPSLPGCISQGKSEREVLKNIREAIALHVKSLAEDGLPLKRTNGAKEVLVSIAV